MIDGAGRAIANAQRLVAAAELFGVPVSYTEQNAKGLGPTLPDLPAPADAVVHKMSFDATRAGGLLGRIAEHHSVVVSGCEAHVCVLQTVLGLREAGRQVYVVRDAIGSRRPENKAEALRRMARHGAEIVTTEMVVFEWLETAEHPRFKEAIALIK
ncbi:isochorismatase family protein [soil metagenome]